MEKFIYRGNDLAILSFTSDIWSDCSKRSFICCTIHYFIPCLLDIPFMQNSKKTRVVVNELISVTFRMKCFNVIARDKLKEQSVIDKLNELSLEV